jgi:hypothetical protein
VQIGYRAFNALEGQAGPQRAAEFTGIGGGNEVRLCFLHSRFSLQRVIVEFLQALCQGEKSFSFYGLGVPVNNRQQPLCRFVDKRGVN